MDYFYALFGKLLKTQIPVTKTPYRYLLRHTSIYKDVPVYTYKGVLGCIKVYQYQVVNDNCHVNKLVETIFTYFI